MLTLHTAFAFFSMAVLLALSPGPDNVFVMMQSISHGRRAGGWTVLGLCTGLIGHTLAVALGLAAVVATSELAFSVLKYAGAGYLLYLAWGAWHAPASLAPTSGQPTQTSPSAASMWRRGVLMNLTNPKVAIFFLALLPQFVSPSQGAVGLQIMSLGLLFMLATALVFGGIVLLAGSLRGWLGQSARIQQAIQRAASLVFAGLALRLLLLERD